MNNGKTEQIGEREYEMVELLRKLNMNRSVALVLACLSTGEEVTSRSIEKKAGLRQPEVSIAMRYLCDNNWIEVREEKKTEGKGRPVKLYKLVVPLEYIIQRIENDVMYQKLSVLESIERLKSLT
ncbi:transcriptional regulator [Methanomethylovorans sp.]|uniref:transcriptional regulator n=1 Tax=Methanomethylovorans sp. TaxID=2758717 RepID=UPI002FDDF768